MTEHEKKLELKEKRYNYFFVLVTIVSFIVVCVDSSDRLDRLTKERLLIADSVICLIFFYDFLRRLHNAQKKLRYMLTFGWLDLLSCTPLAFVLFLESMNWVRFLKLLTLTKPYLTIALRLLRVSRLLSHMMKYVCKNRANKTFFSAVVFSLAIVASGSVAILNLEQHDPNATIDSWENALWWTLDVITSADSDLEPVTRGGHILDVLITCAGLGLSAVFTAWFAAWIMADNINRSNQEEKRLEDRSSDASK